jgi:hypothetical protein
VKQRRTEVLLDLEYHWRIAVVNIAVVVVAVVRIAVVMVAVVMVAVVYGYTYVRQ